MTSTDMMALADVLERAADRLEKPGAWTTKANARDGENWPTISTDPAAVCWCAAGAIFAETEAAGVDGAFEALTAILPPRSDFKDAVVAFNDAPERTQAEVVAKLREAASAARSQMGDT